MLLYYTFDIIASNFVDLFNVYNLRQTISTFNGQNFSSLYSFISVNSSYYVFDYNTQNALLFNEFWEYQGKKTLPSNPRYSVYVNDEIYVSYNSFIAKYDKNLNFILQSNAIGNLYTGIYFNQSNGMLYAASTGYYRIDIFDKNLSYSNNISTSFHPWFVAQYNDMIAVSEYGSTGNIYFFKNNNLTSNIYTSCYNPINSMLFDSYDNVLVLCTNPSYLYVHHTNGTFTGTAFPVCSGSYPAFINFDSKDRLVVVCRYSIEIYY